MPLTEEQQETIVNETLRLFVKYLNHMWDDVQDFTHTVEQFTITDDTRGLYGETNWTVLEEPKDGITPDGLIKITTHNGDEGGPSDLYVGLLAPWTPMMPGMEDVPLHISWIVHIFDTTPNMIYTSDDGLRDPDGKFRKED